MIPSVYYNVILPVYFVAPSVYTEAYILASIIVTPFPFSFLVRMIDSRSTLVWPIVVSYGTEQTSLLWQPSSSLVFVSCLTREGGSEEEYTLPQRTASPPHMVRDIILISTAENSSKFDRLALLRQKLGACHTHLLLVTTYMQSM